MSILEHFVRTIISEASQSDSEHISALFQQIIAKFPAAAGPGAALALALTFAPESRAAFWEKYDKDKAFKALCDKSRMWVRLKGTYFDFINAKTFEEFLRPELKQFDVLVYFENKLHAIEKEKLERLCNIAENEEQFILLVKRVAKEI